MAVWVTGCGRWRTATLLPAGCPSLALLNTQPPLRNRHGGPITNTTTTHQSVERCTDSYECVVKQGESVLCPLASIQRSSHPRFPRSPFHRTSHLRRLLPASAPAGTSKTPRHMRSSPTTLVSTSPKRLAEGRNIPHPPPQTPTHSNTTILSSSAEPRRPARWRGAQAVAVAVVFCQQLYQGH